MIGDISITVKKCTRCLLPESTPGIFFDGEGLCNYCKEHKRIKYKGELELIKMLDSFRNTGQYDCIVTLSGGRDSSYTLLKVAKDYRMRVLAVTYENPYTHFQAKKNIENAINLLNVDIIRLKPKGKMFEDCFKNNFLAWMQRPSLQLLPMLCIPCRTMDLDIYRIAKKLKIRCLVNGANPMQHTSFINALTNLPSNIPFHEAIVKSLPQVLKEIFMNPKYLSPKVIPITVKSYITALINAIGPKHFGFEISSFGFFYFVEWNENEVLSKIRSELNWEHPHNKSNQRFDCPISYLKNFIYLKTIGVTKVNDYYAKMLREGLINPDEAQQRLNKENTFSLNQLQEFFKKIGINPDFSNLKKSFL